MPNYVPIQDLTTKNLADTDYVPVSDGVSAYGVPAIQFKTYTTAAAEAAAAAAEASASDAETTAASLSVALSQNLYSDGSNTYNANLYDINSSGNSETGYYSRQNVFVASDTTWMTDYIPVEAGVEYWTNEAGAGFALAFTSEKSFIGAINNAGSGGESMFLFTNANTRYARFLYGRRIKSSFKVYRKDWKGFQTEHKWALDFIGTHGVIDPASLPHKNLFSYEADNIIGGYYNRNNVYTANAAINQSDYIEVIPGMNYFGSMVVGSFILWYYEDKTFIGYTNESQGVGGKYPAPPFAKYARFLIGADQWDSATVFAEGIYEGIGSGAEAENPWNELTGVAFGTSLTYRAKTTGGYLQFLPSLSGIEFDNQGIGSATIYPNADPNLDILAKVKSYDGYAGKRVAILEGFVNDWTQYYDKLGTWKDTGETTVCGCVRSAINYILSQNPDITVFLVLDHYGRYATNVHSESTATNSAGQTQYEWWEEIAKVGESLGIPVIKQYAISGISENTPQYLLDNIHCNTLGAKQSAYTIWSVMRQHFPNQIASV